MRDFERDYLLYHPNLELKRRVLAEIDMSEEEASKLPKPLLDALNLTGADLLDNINKAQVALNHVIDKLTACMDGKIIDGVSLDDYIKARDNGDYQTIDRYEDFHNNSLDSTTAGEALVYLLDANKDLANHKKYVSDMFYDGNAQYDNVDKHKEEEIKNLTTMVSKEIKSPGVHDYTLLKTKNNLLDAANDRAINITEFVLNTSDVLGSGINKQFDDLHACVTELVDGGKDIIQGVANITAYRFDNLSKISADNRNRTKRLDTTPVRDILQDQMSQMISMQESTSVKLINWINNVADPNNSSPTLKLLSDAVNGLEIMHKSYIASIGDLHKANVLEEIQRQDIVTSLRDKKEAKQVYSLCNKLLDQFDFENPNTHKEIERFIQDNDFDKPGKYCE